MSFTLLKRISFVHSAIYAALLYAVAVDGHPEPLTFILGLSHGLIWIGMSMACLVAVRLRILPLRLGVAVALLGGIGPFFGSAEFIRTQRAAAR